MLFFSPLYIFVVLLPAIAITGWAAWRVRSAYGKWARVDSGIDQDPLDFARYLLDRQGLSAAEQQVSMRLERIMKQRHDSLLQLRLHVDQEITATDHIQSRKGRVGQHVLAGEDAHATD